MAAGKNRNAKTAAFRRPPDEKALEITLLRFPNPEVHLRDGAGKDEGHGRGQAGNGQLQRSDEANEFAQHCQKRIDWRNAVNFGFCSSTRAAGPVNLKNQLRPSCRVHAARTRADAPAISTVEIWRSPA